MIPLEESKAVCSPPALVDGRMLPLETAVNESGLVHGVDRLFVNVWRMGQSVG